eukprot:gb/GFBE01003693.1/.p1 GENE.gb/GFBE01003693.1/~~gb/GFBE01003693.1/.p1  ORF type:complete len:517 (+),score=97.30 gb/GFBE01003693.1/:1-1551(+)
MVNNLSALKPPQDQKNPKLVRATSSLHELSGESHISQIAASVVLIFFPTLVSRLAWIGMKTTDTALLGHSGTDFLTASSLSDFWTSISGVFVSDRVLAPLCAHAYGAKNYDGVAIWVQVSWTLFSWLLVPVVALWLVTSPVLQHGLGTDPQIAGYAGYYSAVMALCLPARLISGNLTTFFTSQKITGPSATTTPMALVLNLVFGLQLVLGIPFAGYAFGFWACPLVTTGVEWFLTIFLVVVYCGIYRYHEKCWTPKVQQWSFVRDVVMAPVLATAGSETYAYYNANIRPKLSEYIRLALPATLAMASDYWRMSAIGLLAGTLGDKEVAVFNASYRFAWMNMVIIGSFSTATVTQLGIALGTGDGQLCRKIRDLGIGSVAVFLLITTALTVIYIEPLAGIFSSDPEVKALFVECRFEMGLMIFFMCFAVHFESLLTALKKTDTLFKAALAGSWLGQVPAVVALLYFYGKHLQGVYLGVGLGYVLLFVLYMVPFLQADLDEAAERACKEAQASEPLDA